MKVLNRPIGIGIFFLARDKSRDSSVNSQKLEQMEWTSDASYGSGKLEPHTDATYLRAATG